MTLKIDKKKALDKMEWHFIYLLSNEEIRLL